MSVFKPVALILGAGAGIGSSVARKLVQDGYRVALGSRNLKLSNGDEYFHVQVDVQRPDSIKAAVETTTRELGPPSVLIYNAASVAPPAIPDDPLSIPHDSFYEAVSLGSGVFTAAQAALPSFRHEANKSFPKTVIVTGNALPLTLETTPLFLTLGLQKTIEARFIATASRAYEKEGIRFYFATLVSKDGGIPSMDVFASSASTHAQVYSQLIKGSHQNWDHRFDIEGNTFVPSA